jgi:GTP-binding protein EngB required for normal cell division
MVSTKVLIELFEKLASLKGKYYLDIEDNKKTIQEINNFMVTLPIIGNFSTGKSSMLNAILEKELLPVGITPETSVPTEIYYGDNKVFRYTKEGEKEYDVSKLPLKGLSIEDTDLIKIEYEHDFLQQIPTVKVVDLPGFDSNIGLHNRAIEKYLPNSLAFFLVISSDEPVLKSSIADFLKVLKLHEMPIYVIITKTARLLDPELEACKSLVKKIVNNIFEIDDVKIAYIESYGNVRVGEVKDFLLEVQGNADIIFRNKYTEILRHSAKLFETYLLERLDKKDLNTSQLEEEREEILKKKEKLIAKIELEKKLFQQQTEECIVFIKEKVVMDLKKASTAIAVYILNGTPMNDKINIIIQAAVVESIKKEFEPRLQKYLHNINEIVSFDNTWDKELTISQDNLISENRAKTILVRLSPIVLIALGSISGPLLAIIGGVMGIFTDALFNLNSVKTKERKAQEAADEIIIAVSNQVNISISKELKNYVSHVNEFIAKEIEEQNEIVERSLMDIENQLEMEEYGRQRDLQGIQLDLEEVKQFIFID